MTTMITTTSTTTSCESLIPHSVSAFVVTLTNTHWVVSRGLLSLSVCLENIGDMVTTASDEELIIALTEMSGPVYKLIIDIKSEKKSEDISSKESQIHSGIVCDGCEKTPIVGHR